MSRRRISVRMNMNRGRKTSEQCKWRERKCETIFFINTFFLRTFVINLLSAFHDFLVGDVEFVFTSPIQYLAYLLHQHRLDFRFSNKLFYHLPFPFLVQGASQPRAPDGGVFCHHNGSNFITISRHYELTLGCAVVCNLLHGRPGKCSDARGRRNSAAAALCTDNGRN
jgi:hypothetical protein